MNENLDLIEILKDCPSGTKFYSTVHGNVWLEDIDPYAEYPIYFRFGECQESSFAVRDNGHLLDENCGECIVFPSKDQRDWSKFKVDLSIDVPVMVKTETSEWMLRYYAGDEQTWIYSSIGEKVSKTGGWKYIIPFDKFDPYNIVRCLQYNIVK